MEVALPEGARRLDAAVYHAAPGMTHHLLEELGEWDRQDGDLLMRSGPALPVRWVRNVWREPFLLEFSSVGEAAAKLRSVQRNWAPCPNRLFRRTALLAEKLPRLPVKPKAFPFELPAAPMGAFSLLDEGLLLGSADCSSPFPNGELRFEEDTLGPPSRAYRKLWEALVLAGRRPGPGDRCLDAGASPGGWTWALAGLGAKVLAVDRSPLEPRIAALPGVEFRKGNAFTLEPGDTGQMDWLLSDVICYPPVLFAWVEKWIASGLAKNYVCTIKMQGENYDRETTDRFAALPGGRIVHLWHNKHELTWIKVTGER